MPVKVTWKSLFGVLVSLGGVATQAYQSNSTSSPHPTSGYNALLVLAGAGIVAAERIADAWDNKTSLTAKIAGVGQVVKSLDTPQNVAAVDSVATAAPAAAVAVGISADELDKIEAEAREAVAKVEALIDKAKAARATLTTPAAPTSHSVA